MGKKTLPPELLDYTNDIAAAVLLNTPRAGKALLWSMLLFVTVALIWAYFAELEEVTSGMGKVIPSSQIQVVSNLEGGIVRELYIREGQQVEKGQVLLLIDDTRFLSDLREREQEIAALQGDVRRLKAEINSIHILEDPGLAWRAQVKVEKVDLEFPDDFREQYPGQPEFQRSLFSERLGFVKNQLSIFGNQIEQREQEVIETNAKVRTLQRGVSLAAREVNMSRPLAREGIVPQVEILRLERQLNEMQGELESTRLLLPKLDASLRENIFKRKEVALTFRSEAQKELNERRNRLAQLQQGEVGLQDRVRRTSVTSPVKGTIKTLNVNTVGGIVQPGVDLVEIVPLEDTLLVEARIEPKDIGFLRPGLEAMVKFTAYDFTIYGGLVGEVEKISADSIQDEEGNTFFLATIRTSESFLGQETAPLRIIPGMQAGVDIITGKKTVLDYLLKPILRARQSALRER
ncbi:HlyD family type I secretion periplasmic adaptor subunit [Oceanisphaera arctica]|uniref:Membrane fusion protein (MFP) family protein n=1 Tax=Oceanisphaera arctica TaxID=641510 RepID=A0A2P5TLQ2_9GAMM|nr:HlyD family type I secretion periplasmic adaptor subunit [Oceanisphaera arctica]PPL16221.1 hemolysin secretion protein D [Oceanisphaera arctica]GHA11560.1 HlyD family type I secretion periplasmic adaptor subunit [Oceanisphaera arctica]